MWPSLVDNVVDIVFHQYFTGASCWQQWNPVNGCDHIFAGIVAVSNGVQ